MITKIKTDRFEPGTPERAAAEYMLCWQQQDWLNMCEHCQRSWVLGKEIGQPHLILKQALQVFRVRNLITIDNTTEPKKTGLREIIFQDLKVRVEMRGPAGHKTVFLLPRVIREDEHGQPNASGAWGVNPVSAIRGLV